MSNRKKTKEEIERDLMIRAYRLQIHDEELLARMNKATFEKMHYFIEGTKIIPEYGRLLKEQQDMRDKQIQKADAVINEVLETPEAPIPTEQGSAESGSLQIGTTEIQ